MRLSEYNAIVKHYFFCYILSSVDSWKNAVFFRLPVLYIILARDLYMPIVFKCRVVGSSEIAFSDLWFQIKKKKK